jgi:hypothetical protein
MLGRWGGVYYDKNVSDPGHWERALIKCAQPEPLKFTDMIYFLGVDSDPQLFEIGSRGQSW